MWGIEFGTRLNQTNDLKIDICRFLDRRLALLGFGKDWLAHGQDNVTEYGNVMVMVMVA